MDATSNLQLPFIMAAQAQKHVTHNEALRALDAVVQLMVLDKDLSSPPGSPAEGARYIVAASPTGAWSGQAGKVAAYQDGAWAFYVPREGWFAWAADEDALYVWTGSAWTAFAGGGGSLDNVVEDTTPQLGADLDANGHNIGFDDGTGITDDAGNPQLLFHKTATAVNRVGVTNAAAGTAPQIAAEGGDTDIDLTLAGKGAGHPKAALFGVNATADATTKFVVAAEASLFNHAGNGHQHKINKNAAGDTASLLFQTGTSGRAEMGTAGDDDFHFKVSPDGSTWHEAIVIDRATGMASFPLTPRREVLAANRTYYVRTDGNDSNTGLVNSSGGAFLTIQKAIDTAASIDCATFNLTIQVGAGTFTSPVALKRCLGSGTFQIVGAGVTTIIGVTTDNAFFSEDAGAWLIDGVKITASAGSCVFARGNTNLLVGSTAAVEFGAAAGAHVRCDNGARVRLFTHTISGSAGNHFFTDVGGRITCASVTVTLTGTPAFTAFAQADGGSLMFLPGITFSGAATGPRYGVTLNSVINTAGGGASYLPGNAGGSTATGGQYA